MPEHKADPNKDFKCMNFAEIILTYARNPPLHMANYLKVGRRSGRGNGAGYYVLLKIEEIATTSGADLKDVRQSMKRVLGVWPENLSRPLTIDEAFTLCDMHKLDISTVLKAGKELFDARNHEQEDDL